MNLSRNDFVYGRKFRVIKYGAYLSGTVPIAPYAQQGWRENLNVGDIITCDGESWTNGDDIPIIKWSDENGKFLANDCEFKPSVGSMWCGWPNPEYLKAMP